MTHTPFFLCLGLSLSVVTHSILIVQCHYLSWVQKVEAAGLALPALSACRPKTWKLYGSYQAICLPFPSIPILYKEEATV